MSIKNILLVDDDDINLFVGEKVLTRGGFNVDKANSGAKALELTKEKLFDLILMDVNMPLMDGIQTAKYIRKEANLNNEIPIFVLSSHEEQEAKRIASDNNLNGFLPKPIQVADVQEAISKL